MKTLFEKIIERQLPAAIVYETETIIAIKDIAPKAPIHLLIIPKKAIPDLQTMQKEDATLLWDVVQAAQELAKQHGLEENGYRLLVNNGTHAGQTIYHLHFHLLGGAPLGAMG